VDRDGYNGRDFHPASVDRGQVFVVLALTVYDWTKDDGSEQSLLNRRARERLNVLEHQPGDLETVFECVSLTTGRRVTFMGHEVEVL
jgi:hypothetical protein